MKKMILCSTALSVLALSGCAQPQLNKTTQSGKPEAIFAGKSKDDVKEILVVRCLDKGGSVSDDTPYSIVCSQDAGGAGTFAQLMVGSAHHNPTVNLKYTLTEKDGSTKVYGDMWMDVKDDLGISKKIPLDGNQNKNEIQQLLDMLASTK